jgi:hypothetical protein
VIFFVNFITLILIALIFYILYRYYMSNGLFDVSILYMYTIFLAPLILFGENLILTIILRSEHILFSFTPLIIPFIYVIFLFYSNSIGRYNYKKIRSISFELLSLTNEKGVDMDINDIRIRLNSRNKVTIIFNVYSKSDEKITRSLFSQFKTILENNLKNLSIELYIDKKKELIKLPIQILEN